MKIGILGSGDVGQRLADGFIELGYAVKIGSRDPNQKKVTEWIDKHDNGRASAGTFAEAALFGELNVLATSWAGTAEAIRMVDPQNFAGKVVIDNILTKFGWETIDIGGIEAARLLEPLALLWITHYFRTGNGDHAFKLLRK